MKLSDLIVGSFVGLLFIIVLWRNRLARIMFLEAIKHPLTRGTITIAVNGVTVENSQNPKSADTRPVVTQH
jgi:hypothetical protein